MSKADSRTRLCGEVGCGRPMRARDLCSTHYNHTYQPERHRKLTVACGWCGKACEKQATGRYAARFCSLTCRDAMRGPHSNEVCWRSCAHCGGHWSDPDVRECRRARCSRLRRLEQVSQIPIRVFAAGQCQDCGTAFVAECFHDAARYCSERCKRRAAGRRRKAKEFGAYGMYTWTEVMKVFLLFDRCCAYCTVRIEGEPEPDHVHALARGGHNTIGNILPSCSACNSHKRDLSLTEWAEDRARRGMPPRVTTWDANDVRYAHLTAQPSHSVT